jgi:hypothetical protein
LFLLKDFLEVLLLVDVVHSVYLRSSLVTYVVSLPYVVFVGLTQSHEVGAAVLSPQEGYRVLDWDVAGFG